MATDPETLPYRPCVGVTLINGSGLIFAGERLDTAGAWQMPQGGIDAGETPEAAALRELEEETSVPAEAVTALARTEDWLYYDFPPEIRPKLAKGKYRGQKQLWFLYRLNGSDRVINLSTADNEFAAWRWMTSADLLGAIVPFKRDVYTKVLREFSDYLSSERT